MALHYLVPLGPLMAAFAISARERGGVGVRGLLRRVLRWRVAPGWWLFALASPLFLMTVYNKVIGQRALDTFAVLIIGMVTLYVFDVVLSAVRGYVSSYTGARLNALIGS